MSKIEIARATDDCREECDAIALGATHDPIMHTQIELAMPPGAIDRRL